MSWIWPIMEDMETARESTHLAAVWAGILALLSVIGALLSRNPTIYGFVALCYLIVAWRVWCGSLPWAVVGSALCILDTVLSLMTLPLLSFVMPFALLATINGLRATHFLSSAPAASDQARL